MIRDLTLTLLKTHKIVTLCRLMDEFVDFFIGWNNLVVKYTIVYYQCTIIIYNLRPSQFWFWELDGKALQNGEFSNFMSRLRYEVLRSKIVWKVTEMVL